MPNCKSCDEPIIWGKTIHGNGGKNMSISNLVGFARKSLSGESVKLNISVDAFDHAERYTGADGHEFVGLFIGLRRLYDILEGNREVTSVCQMVSPENEYSFLGDNEENQSPEAPQE